MSVARELIREKVIDQLYAGKDIVRSTTTSAGDDSSGLTDTQLKKGMFEATDYIGAYVLFSSGTTTSAQPSLVVDDPLTSGATTINVTEGGDFDNNQYIIIESEWISITSISTNALTVVRGILGTTAAAHVQTTPVNITTDMQASKIIAFDRVAGKFALSPALRSTPDNSADYEIHYDLHPFRVNAAITWAIEVGSRNALTAPDADAETTTLDVETVVEGVLAYCKFAIADQTEARDPAARQSDVDKEELRRQAVIHETNWLRGLSLAGYRPFIVSQRTQEDEQVSEEGG